MSGEDEVVRGLRDWRSEAYRAARVQLQAIRRERCKDVDLSLMRLAIAYFAHRRGRVLTACIRAALKRTPEG